MPAAGNLKNKELQKADQFKNNKKSHSRLSSIINVTKSRLLQFKLKNMLAGWS